MVRIGIIADIHANEEALSAVLAAMGRVDRLFCLGDVVGYGASPESCIALRRDSGTEAILGNHELGLLGRLEPSWFNAHAQTALEWQRPRISKASMDWLDSLPGTLEFEDVYLVHGAPPRSQTKYTLKACDVETSMHFVRHRVCMVGHTHVPALFTKRGNPGSRVLATWDQVLVRPNTTMRYSSADRLLVNPGSVGQPRDGLPLAAFAVLDTFRRELTLRRVPYAVGEAKQRIEESGLPTILGDRLLVGR